MLATEGYSLGALWGSVGDLVQGALKCVSVCLCVRGEFWWAKVAQMERLHSLMDS